MTVIVRPAVKSLLSFLRTNRHVCVCVYRTTEFLNLDHVFQDTIRGTGTMNGTLRPFVIGAAWLKLQ